jgi:hypothetical protein
MSQSSGQPEKPDQPPIHVTTDGGVFWLQCFADDPSDGIGKIIKPVEPGDSWWDLAAAVDAHITEHGC